ncbi:FAD-dependent monooxygenase [Nocardioides campestrisoli]|uniref:FAD-dependent monooxygenase n=1 Tax=Nocardioides campestrisoli TaxID=2736757 RepID=UPI00163D7FAD|nr:FAD-dependent monooxygenase [Nocardioides campestrisoli]
MNDVIDTDVLIIGAGPVGLALALDLARRGVPSVVVDDTAVDTGVLPAKAGLLNERTMEICRQWGVADEVRAAGAPADYPRDTVYCTALVGGELIGRSQVPPISALPRDLSPETTAKCPQFIFDPILERAALETGLVDLRRPHRLVAYREQDGSVTAEVADMSATGRRTETISAAYLVGCDGAASTVRRQAGIPFDGGTLDYSISVITEIESLEDHHPFGRAERFMFIDERGTWCNVTSMDYQKYWRFTFLGYPEKPALDEFDAEAAVAAAVGSSDLPLRILGAVPWRRSESAARTYHQGRVFLAGDAAHTTSPTGGHGLNTGIGDAATLGWILAGLVDGWAGPEAAEAYTAERRPVALRNSGISSVHYRNWVDGVDFRGATAPGAAGKRERERIGRDLADVLSSQWSSQGVSLGYRYEDSGLIVDDGSVAPPDDPSSYTPTAKPGHRAPHVVLKDGRSTLDLFGAGFTLLSFGERDEHDEDVALLQAAAMERGLPLKVEHIDEPDARSVYERQLVLVRPDGMVAWRDDLVGGATVAAQVVDTARGAGSPTHA